MTSAIPGPDHRGDHSSASVSLLDARTRVAVLRGPGHRRQRGASRTRLVGMPGLYGPAMREQW